MALNDDPIVNSSPQPWSRDPVVESTDSQPWSRDPAVAPKLPLNTLHPDGQREWQKRAASEISRRREQRIDEMLRLQNLDPAKPENRQMYSQWQPEETADISKTFYRAYQMGGYSSGKEEIQPPQSVGSFIGETVQDVPKGIARGAIKGSTALLMTPVPTADSANVQRKVGEWLDENLPVTPGFVSSASEFAGGLVPVAAAAMTPGGIPAAIATGAALGRSNAANEIGTLMQGITPEEQSAMLAQGYTVEQIQAADVARKQAAAQGSVAGQIAGAIKGSVEGYVMPKLTQLGGKLVGGIGNRVVRRASSLGVDAALNTAQAAPSQIASNLIAQQTYDPTRETTEGVVEAMKMAPFASLPFGPMSVKQGEMARLANRRRLRANRLARAQAVRDTQTAQPAQPAEIQVLEAKRAAADAERAAAEARTREIEARHQAGLEAQRVVEPTVVRPTPEQQAAPTERPRVVPTEAELRSMSSDKLKQVADEWGVVYDSPSLTVPRLVEAISEWRNEDVPIANTMDRLNAMSDKELWNAARDAGLKASNRETNIRNLLRAELERPQPTEPATPPRPAPEPARPAPPEAPVEPEAVQPTPTRETGRIAGAKAESSEVESPVDESTIDADMILDRLEQSAGGGKRTRATRDMVFSTTYTGEGLASAIGSNNPDIAAVLAKVGVVRRVTGGYELNPQAFPQFNNSPRLTESPPLSNRAVETPPAKAPVEPEAVQPTPTRETGRDGDSSESMMLPWDMTETSRMAADLGFTAADRAAMAMIESKGGQINLSGLPAEDWYTYRTPEGLIFQSDVELVGKGGYSQLANMAKQWLQSRQQSPVGKTPDPPPPLSDRAVETPPPEAPAKPAEPAPARVSDIDTPAQGVLAQARAGKKLAWKKVQELRRRIKAEPLAGNAHGLRVELMKAASAHQEYLRMERGALKAIEGRANELGQTTVAAKPAEPPQPAANSESLHQKQATADLSRLPGATMRISDVPAREHDGGKLGSSQNAGKQAIIELPRQATPEQKQYLKSLGFKADWNTDEQRWLGTVSSADTYNTDAPAAKEPWQMSRAEFDAYLKSQQREIGPRSPARRAELHREAVDQAIAAGKIDSHPDYPDAKKPAPKTRRPTKQSIEAKIRAEASRLGIDDEQQTFDAIQRLNRQKHGGAAFSTRFSDKLPGEVEEYLRETRPDLRKYVRVVKPGDSGYQAADGLDSYENLGPTWYRQLEALDADSFNNAKQYLAKHGDQTAQFLVKLHENWPEQPAARKSAATRFRKAAEEEAKAAAKATDPDEKFNHLARHDALLKRAATAEATAKEAKPLDTVNVRERELDDEWEFGGHKFRVTLDEDGGLILRDGQEFDDIPLDWLPDQLPIDKGTLRKAPEPEVPDEPFAPKPEAEPEVDLLGRPAFKAEPGQQEVMPFKAVSDAEARRQAAAETAKRKAEAPSAEDAKLQRKFGKTESGEMFPDPPMSIADAAPRGVPVERLDAATKAMRARFPGAKIKIVKSDTELPGDAQSAIEARGVRGRVQDMVVGDGTVYVIADNIDDVRQGIEKTWHGIVGHVGADAGLTDHQRAIIVKWARTHAPEIVKAVKARYQRTERAREIIAFASERFAGAEKPAWYQRVLSLLRYAWRRITGQNYDIADVERIIQRAARAAERQTDRTGDPMASIAAWHGTPHEWAGDKADISKVGTGEGAQAYGHGLYFAGKKEVAEYYKDSLSKKRTGVNPYNFDHNGHQYTTTNKQRFKDGSPVAQDEYSAAFREAQDLYEKLPEGRLYKVELAPDDAELLDWDKPLSQQSEKVKAAMIGLMTPAEIEHMKTWKSPDWARLDGQSPDIKYEDSIEGGTLYRSMSQTMGGGRKYDDAALSTAMHKAGIRGIRYADADSRSTLPVEQTSQGKWVVQGVWNKSYNTRAEALAAAEAGAGKTHNYVIFDDADVKVTAKFSLADSAGADTPEQIEAARKAWLEKNTDSPWFRRWFGNSKVVDAQGKPLVVYHGTQADFEAFNPGGSIDGIFGTVSAEEASRFADPPTDNKSGANVKALHFSIQDPNIHDEHGNLFDFKRMKSFVVRARGDGRDGVIVRNVRNFPDSEPSTTYVAFHPHQVKSATGNRGTFDPANPDIRFSIGPPRGQRPPLPGMEPAAPEAPGDKAQQIKRQTEQRVTEVLTSLRTRGQPADMPGTTPKHKSIIKRALSLQKTHANLLEDIAGDPNSNLAKDVRQYNVLYDDGYSAWNKDGTHTFERAMKAAGRDTQTIAFDEFVNKLEDVDLPDTKQKVKLTRAEQWALAATSEDADVRAKMERVPQESEGIPQDDRWSLERTKDAAPIRISVADMDFIRTKRLDPRERSAIAAMRNWILSKRDPLAAVHTDLTGKTLQFIDGYWMTQRKRNEVADATPEGWKGNVEVGQALARAMEMVPSTHERTGGTEPRILRGIHEQYADYVRDTGVLVNLAPHVNRMAMVLRDPRTQAEIQRVYGASVNDDVKRMIDDMLARDVHDKTGFGRFTRRLSSNIGKAAIAANPVVGGMNTLGGTSMLYGVFDAQDIRPTRMFDTELRERVRQDPFVWQRQHSGVYSAHYGGILGERTQQAQLGFKEAAKATGRAIRSFRLRDAMRHVGQMGDAITWMKSRDMDPIVVAFDAAANETRRLHPELTGEAFETRVRERAREAIRLTQNGSTPLELTGASSMGRRNAGLAALLMFSNDAIKKFNLLASAKKGERLKRGLTVAASAIVAAMVRSAWNTGAEEVGYAVGGGERPGDDTEKRLTTAAWDFLDNVGGMVYGGAQAIRSLRGMTSGRGISGAWNPLDVPMDRVVIDFTRHMAALVKAATTNPPKKGLRTETYLGRLMAALGDVANDTAMLTGIPTTPIVRVGERVGRAANFDKLDQLQKELLSLNQRHAEERRYIRIAKENPTDRAEALQRLRERRLTPKMRARHQWLNAVKKAIDKIRKAQEAGRISDERADELVERLLDRIRETP